VAGAFRGAHAHSDHRVLWPGDTGAVRVSGEECPLFLFVNTLLAVSHGIQPPDLACDGDNQCLKRIPPEQVLAKARQMLEAARTPDPAAGEIA